jgi:hypothetical protein
MVLYLVAFFNIRFSFLGGGGRMSDRSITYRPVLPSVCRTTFPVWEGLSLLALQRLVMPHSTASFYRRTTVYWISELAFNYFNHCQTSEGAIQRGRGKISNVNTSHFSGHVRQRRVISSGIEQYAVRWKPTDVSEESSIKQVTKRTRFMLVSSLFFDY